MKIESTVNTISDEVLAAYLDANATDAECINILDALYDDEDLREVMHISQLVDDDLAASSIDNDFLPMTAMAASCTEGCTCSLECEKYILNQLSMPYDEQIILNDAITHGWQKEQGTALHNVGRHLENFGLIVTRRYHATIEDISSALEAGLHIIVAVDGGELLGNRDAEILEDIFVGENPDHTVVILNYELDRNTITLFDPNSSNIQDTYPIEQFLDAWADSKNYLVTVSCQESDTYVPHLIDLSDVELGDELIELREAIAEHAHDVWAAERQSQGWTYGPQRNDELKQTPCMVPYSKLPDSEKTFDRDMAMNTIKLLKKLGWDIVKRK